MLASNIQNAVQLHKRHSCSKDSLKTPPQLEVTTSSFSDYRVASNKHDYKVPFFYFKISLSQHWL